MYQEWMNWTNLTLFLGGFLVSLVLGGLIQVARGGTTDQSTESKGTSAKSPVPLRSLVRKVAKLVNLWSPRKNGPKTGPQAISPSKTADYPPKPLGSDPEASQRP